MARANRHFIPGYIWHLTHQASLWLRPDKSGFAMASPRQVRLRYGFAPTSQASLWLRPDKSLPQTGILIEILP